MTFKIKKGFEIDGNLEIIISENTEQFEGNTDKWQEVLIHGDKKGLKSLAEQLNYLADLDQDNVPDKLLPIGAREHLHLRPNFELSKNSLTTIIGRLDSKGTKKFHDKFIPKERK
jgi:hypothetical protein